MGHRRRGMVTNCVSYNRQKGDAWTKSTSPIITHKGDVCLQNESAIRTYKGDIAYKPRLLYLKYEMGNDKVRRRYVSGSLITSLLGDAD